MQIELKRERMLTGLSQELDKKSNGKDKEEIRTRFERLKKKMKVFKKFSSNLMEKKKSHNKLYYSERPLRLSYEVNQMKRGHQVKRGKRKENYLPQTPHTPHNTTQYLTHNFKRGRKEQVMNLLSDYSKYLEDDHYTWMIDEIITIDDICVTGGSMKGLINFESNEETSEEKTELTHRTSELIFQNEDEFYSEEDMCKLDFNYYSDTRSPMMESTNGRLTVPLTNCDNNLTVFYQKVINKQREEILRLQNQIEQLKDEKIDSFKIFET